MVVSEIRLYELLKNKIGEREAEAFVEILENKIEKKFEDKKSELATKEDIFTLKDEIGKVKSDLLKTIYLTSLGQLVAIIGSVITLILLYIKR